MQLEHENTTSAIDKSEEASRDKEPAEMPFTGRLALRAAIHGLFLDDDDRAHQLAYWTQVIVVLQRNLSKAAVDALLLEAAAQYERRRAGG